ncbi:MAG: hypothetical protein H7321_05335 [Bacteroidia bacterium]|nr:hypothetical protein [Bacteroidia bacterium]
MKKGPIFFSRHQGIGDAVFVNTVAWHCGHFNKCKVIIGTNHKEIFRNNPYVRIFPFTSEKMFFRFVRLLRILGFSPQHFVMTYQAELKETPHIMDALCKKAGMHIHLSKPLIFLTEKELSKKQLPVGEKPWLAIHSTGLTDWTDNKNYYPERFEEVVLALKSKYNIVQLGLESDPALSADLDLRGKLTVRETAALFYECKLFIGQVGFLMHAAEAASCRSIIIYGGFEAPWQHDYPHQQSIYSPVSCAPCWQLICPYDKKCMDMIMPSTIVEMALG